MPLSYHRVQEATQSSDEPKFRDIASVAGMRQLVASCEVGLGNADLAGEETEGGALVCPKPLRRRGRAGWSAGTGLAGQASRRAPRLAGGELALAPKRRRAFSAAHRQLGHHAGSAGLQP